MNKEVSWQTFKCKQVGIQHTVRLSLPPQKRLYDCMKIPLDQPPPNDRERTKKYGCMKIPLDQPPPHGSNERSHRPALQICQALAPTHIWLFKKSSDGRLLLLYFSFAQLHQHDQRCLLTCISLCVSLIILRGRAAIVRGGEERQAEGDRGFASKVWNPQTQVKNWS